MELASAVECIGRVSALSEYRTVLRHVSALSESRTVLLVAANALSQCPAAGRHRPLTGHRCRIALPAPTRARSVPTATQALTALEKSTRTVASRTKAA